MTIVHLQWLDALITLAVPKTLTMAEAKEQCKEWVKNVFSFEKEADMLSQAFLDPIEDSDIITGWNSEGYDFPIR